MKISELLLKLDRRSIIRFPDKIYLKMRYKLNMGKKLNISNPQTFNEKLQWLKLYDRNPEYTKMVDKYEVKKYVSYLIGEECIIPTLAVYDDFDEIEWNKLPDKFVIKCTHDSGGITICKDRNEIEKKKLKQKMLRCLKQNYYYNYREWPYKNVRPRIIIEKYMEDREEKDLKDYKIFCFNGKVQNILVCSNRKGSFKNTDFYDKQWNVMPFTRAKHKNNPQGIKKPRNLQEMLRIAEILSKNIPFVRVDLYEINGKVYFGELTFYPSSGFEGFEPEKYDKILGEMLELPIKKNEEKNEK